MVRGVLKAIEAVSTQTSIQQKQLRDFQSRKELAHAAWKNVESEYKRAKQIISRNLSKLQAKTDELNELLGSQSVRTDQEVRKMTTLPVLESLLETDGETDGEDENVEDEDEEEEIEGEEQEESDHPNNQQPHTQRRKLRSKAIAPGNSSAIRGDHSRFRQSRAERAGSVIDLVSESSRKPEEDDTFHEPLSEKSDERTPRSSCSERETSIYSNINVAQSRAMRQSYENESTGSRVNSPDDDIFKFPTAMNKKPLQTESETCYQSDSSSSDGLFVAVHKKSVPRKAAREEDESEVDRALPRRQSEPEADDLFGEPFNRLGSGSRNHSGTSRKALSRFGKASSGSRSGAWSGSSRINVSALDQLIADAVMQNRVTDRDAQQASGRNSRCTTGSTGELFSEDKNAPEPGGIGFAHREQSNSRDRRLITGNCSDPQQAIHQERLRHKFSGRFSSTEKSTVAQRGIRRGEGGPNVRNASECSSQKQSMLSLEGGLQASGARGKRRDEADERMEAPRKRKKRNSNPESISP